VTRELFPPVSLERLDADHGNYLLTAWAHPLGACERPFRQEFHGLYVHGSLVGVTVSASTVSATVRDGDRTWRRAEVVELARIARHPEQPWVLRPLLRLWREVLAPAWPCWPLSAAVSYALPGTSGDLYRFDGWRRVGPVRPSGGGGSWTSSAPAANAVADGVKTLWIHEYRTGGAA
jgi:hypothetical protein